MVLRGGAPRVRAAADALFPSAKISLFSPLSHLGHGGHGLGRRAGRQDLVCEVVCVWEGERGRERGVSFFSIAFCLARPHDAERQKNRHFHRHARPRQRAVGDSVVHAPSGGGPEGQGGCGRGRATADGFRKKRSRRSKKKKTPATHPSGPRRRPLCRRGGRAGRAWAAGAEGAGPAFFVGGGRGGRVRGALGIRVSSGAGGGRRAGSARHSPLTLAGTATSSAGSAISVSDPDRVVASSPSPDGWAACWASLLCVCVCVLGRRA